VAVRIRKLKETGCLDKHTGINPLKMGLNVAKVDITSTNMDDIVKMYRDCPYFAHCFTVSGKYNLCIFLVSENIEALEAWVNYHLRSLDSVSDIAFNLIMDSEKNMIIPMAFIPGVAEDPPCGNLLICERCPYYQRGRCLGCPATGENKGWLSSDK